MLPGDSTCVAVTPISGVTCDTVVFRIGGQLHVAAIVKATFVIAQDRPMLLTDPDPILRVDEHLDANPASSLVATSDLVPYRPHANVLLRGHARAPAGRPTSAVAVRLMVARDGGVPVDKRLAVRGAPDPAARPPAPAPFTGMPLVYELAMGGPGSPENPVGIADGPGQWANIVDPRRRDRPAGFGPISPSWGERRRLLGVHAGALDAPIPDLPRDFAWAYFDVAPEDQRLDFLRGDEWIGFEGMNGQIPRVQSCLPGVRAAARLYGPSPELRGGWAITLAADTLSIDADRLRCWVVWRGHFAVPREEALSTMHVFAGVETAEHPLAFPASYQPPERSEPPLARARRAGEQESSQTLEMPAIALGYLPAATPFDAPASEDGPHTADIPVDFQAAPAIPFGPSTLPPRDLPVNPLPPATPFDHAAIPLHAPPRPDILDDDTVSVPAPASETLGASFLAALACRSEGPLPNPRR